MRIIVGIVVLIVGFFMKNKFLEIGAIIIIFFPLVKKLLSALMKLIKSLFKKVRQGAKKLGKGITKSSPSDDLFSESEVGVQRSYADDLFTDERKQSHKNEEIHSARGFNK